MSHYSSFVSHKYFLKLVTNFIFHAIKVIWGGGLSPNTLITLEHMVMVRGGSSERLYVL